MSAFPPVILVSRSFRRMPAGAILIDLGWREIHGDGAPWIFRKEAPFRHAVALLVNRGNLVTLPELIEHCWGDHRDGGPDAVIGRLGSYAFFWNKRSRLFQVTNHKGLGYRLELRQPDAVRAAA